jgi:hypothetical protein
MNPTTSPSKPTLMSTSHLDKSGRPRRRGDKKSFREAGLLEELASMQASETGPYLQATVHIIGAVKVALLAAVFAERAAFVLPHQRSFNPI